MKIINVKPTSRTVLTCVVREPEQSYESLAEAAQVSRATVARHIASLKLLGYVEVLRGRRAARYIPTDEGRKAVEHVRVS